MHTAIEAVGAEINARREAAQAEQGKDEGHKDGKFPEAW